MEDFFNSIVNSELIFVYGLILLVIILIIVVVVIDRIESKKKPKNLFDTLNMKIINDANNVIEEEKNKEVDVLEVESKQKEEVNFKDLEPIPEVKVNKIEDEEVYVESELEKTQAQIRVEEINEALKNAQIEEKIEEDKYAKFEEEQEKNAIISYNELKKSFDKLYSENEKIQYIDDDEIPINIDELYELSKKEEIKENKVKLDDLSNLKKEDTDTKIFKNSPYISPVYGIQTPPITTKTEVDSDIQSANQFLQSLKELKNNLD